MTWDKKRPELTAESSALPTPRNWLPAQLRNQATSSSESSPSLHERVGYKSDMLPVIMTRCFQFEVPRKPQCSNIPETKPAAAVRPLSCTQLAGFAWKREENQTFKRVKCTLKLESLPIYSFLYISHSLTPTKLSPFNQFLFEIHGVLGFWGPWYSRRRQHRRCGAYASRQTGKSWSCPELARR